LEEGSAARVRAHLAGCLLCAAEREILSATVRLLRALPEADPPAELRRRIGITLLEIERRSERRWVGLSWLARPRTAGWAWGAALGAVAATVGLLVTRGPVNPSSVTPATLAPQVRAPMASPTPKPAIPGTSNRTSAAIGAKQVLPKIAVAQTPRLPAGVPAEVKPAPARAAVVTPAPTLAPRSIATSPSRRRMQNARRSESQPALPTRVEKNSSPRSAPSRLESSAGEAPIAPRSEPGSSSPGSDPPGPDHRSDTDGMTQMASGMTDSAAPTTTTDDLVELRRSLLDRPLQVPELGRLKGASSSRAGRDGWIRF
jgi:hypothetical protein